MAIAITRRLHNTALQRVDRCAAAHGIVAHVPFLDLEVADYALRIPAGLKLRGGVEKWILTVNSKEELMYYRAFRQHFGDVADLKWMGRTKTV